jgi:hypothetical protein
MRQKGGRKPFQYWEPTNITSRLHLTNLVALEFCTAVITGLPNIHVTPSYSFFFQAVFPSKPSMNFLEFPSSYVSTIVHSTILITNLTNKECLLLYHIQIVQFFHRDWVQILSSFHLPSYINLLSFKVNLMRTSVTQTENCSVEC